MEQLRNLYVTTISEKIDRLENLIDVPPLFFHLSKSTLLTITSRIC